MKRQQKKPAIQKKAAVPVSAFAFPRQMAKAASNKPATISNAQFILAGYWLIPRNGRKDLCVLCSSHCGIFLLNAE